MASKDKSKESRSKLHSYIPNKILNKQIIKDSPRATIVIESPATKDRSRFFKDNYEIERRKMLFT